MKVKMFYGTVGGAGVLEQSINKFAETVDVASVNMSSEGLSIIAMVVYRDATPMPVNTPAKARPSRAKRK